MREFGVILAAHGRLASALRASAEMLCGPQRGMETVELDERMGLDEMCAAVAAAAQRLSAYGPLLLLTDLPGGTPDNAALRIACGRAGARLISGVNMPLLCEVSMADGPLDDAMAAALLEAGRLGLRDEADKLARAGKARAVDESEDL
ncbi:MAG: hypothetical protein VB092_05855 [Oscillospiraceae bacterium]|nr:hypothetical protein [Oscillospiraceae bacterium]